MPTELPLCLVLCFSAIAAAAVAQGAYHLRGQVLTGLLLGAAVAFSVIGQRLSLAALRFPPTLLCAALACWALVSAAVAGVPGASIPTVVLLAAVVTTALIVRQAGAAAASILVLPGALVALSGIVGVAWRFEPWTLESQGFWRAASTLTYANAAAGLLVPLALLASALLLEKLRTAPLNAALCLLLVGVGATLSRGGIIAFVLGLAILARLVGHRRLWRAIWCPAAGAAIAIAGLAPSMLVGRPARPLLAVCSVATGVLVAVIPWRVISVQARFMVVGIAIATTTSLLLTSGTAGRSISAARGTRLSLTSDDRVHEAVAAVRLAQDHPLTGAGPGRAKLSWRADDGRLLTAKYAHNEYLQTLAELGLVGLWILLALFASLVVAAYRALRANPDPYRAGAAAGLVALAVNSGVDFLWHIPVIPLMAAALVGLCCSIDQGVPE